MQWIRHNFSGRRYDNQIHVFHGDSAEKHFIPQDDSSNLALAVFKLHSNRPHVRADLTFAVRRYAGGAATGAEVTLLTVFATSV